MPRRGQDRGTTDHGHNARDLRETSCPSQQEGTNHHELKSSQTFCSVSSSPRILHLLAKPYPIWFPKSYIITAWGCRVAMDPGKLASANLNSKADHILDRTKHCLANRCNTWMLAVVLVQLCVISYMFLFFVSQSICETRIFCMKGFTMFCVCVCLKNA